MTLFSICDSCYSFHGPSSALALVSVDGTWDLGPRLTSLFLPDEDTFADPDELRTPEVGTFGFEGTWAPGYDMGAAGREEYVGSASPTGDLRRVEDFCDPEPICMIASTRHGL